MSAHPHIRVGTWNLWWRFGAWDRRGRTIARVLALVDADVLGLQEVWSTERENQAEALAARLGMHFVWAPSPRPERWQERIGDRSVAVGTAILSRWPLAEHDVRALEGAAMPALHAVVDTPAGGLPVFAGPLGFGARCVISAVPSGGRARRIRRREKQGEPSCGHHRRLQRRARLRRNTASRGPQDRAGGPRSGVRRRLALRRPWLSGSDLGQPQPPCRRLGVPGLAHRLRVRRNAGLGEGPRARGSAVRHRAGRRRVALRPFRRAGAHRGGWHCLTPADGPS